MSRRWYLKRVILILKNPQNQLRFHFLAEKRSDWLWSGELQEGFCKEEVLYITDCSRTAEKLREQSLPVLGWLHEEGDPLSGVEYAVECPEELDADYLERVYRRYRGIPWDILETERCMIRETTVEDVDSFFEIYRHPEITRYTEGLQKDKAQEKAYIQDYIDKAYRYYEFGTWTVIWKETGEIIGRAGLAVREGYELPDLGFVIAKPWQGKGIAYEICIAILEYGREELGFEQVQALVRAENEVSLKLCRKLGFVEQREVMQNHQKAILLVRFHSRA